MILLSAGRIAAHAAADASGINVEVQKQNFIDCRIAHFK